MSNEQLASDVKALTEKVADLTETVESLMRIAATSHLGRKLFEKQLIFCLTNPVPDGNIKYSEKQERLLR